MERFAHALDGAKINVGLYDLTFEGDVDFSKPEEVYRRFGITDPENYTGRPLSATDIVEAIDEAGNSVFYYRDGDNAATLSLAPDSSVQKEGSRKMRIRIYQINMERDANRVAFVGSERLERYQGSAEIDSTIYDKVFEGEVDCADLEDVFRMFNLNHPEGYTGRSLSVSDIVEVVEDPIPGNFHFCDTRGFKKVPFHPELTNSKEESK